MSELNVDKASWKIRRGMDEPKGLPIITNPESWAIRIAPPSKVWLVIHDNFRVASPKLPCRWHRFWYRILLGWRWEET